MPTDELTHDIKQKRVLLWLLFIGAVLGTFFCILNMVLHRGVLAFLELIGAFFSIACYAVVQKSSSRVLINRIALVYIFILFSVILYAFYESRHHPSIVAWLNLVPAIGYLVLGRRVAMCLSAVFLVSFLALYHFHPITVLGDYKSTVSNLFMSYISIWLLSHVYATSNEKSQKLLGKLAAQDQLTGLLNRTTLNQVYNMQIEQGSLSLVVLDIDLFKRINDTLGHEAGDTALKLLAQTLLDNVRPGDYVFRLGGEEFCIILPKCNLDDAYKLADDLRKALNKNYYSIAGQQVRLSFSAGVASYSQDEPQPSTLSDLLRLADRRMYQAKSLGRNIVVAQDPANS